MVKIRFTKKIKAPDTLDTQGWINFLKETAEAIIHEKIVEIEKDVSQNLKHDLVSELTAKVKDNLVNDAKGNLMNELRGAQGDTPKVGVDFFLPDDGKPGKDGEDGKPGKDGLHGKPGVTPDPVLIAKMASEFVKQGEDGSPDTPDEIATKLNSLEGVLKLSLFAGLEDKLKDLKRALLVSKKDKKLGGGGGGMGDTQHETKDITSATTTITTDFPIANDGKAIFSFTYNNAVLERTNHYTVGADRKTITFDSDVQAQFENNTTVYIIYAR